MRERDTKPVDCFSKTGTGITHNAIYPVSDITGRYWSSSLLEPQKASYYLFTYCSGTLQNMQAHVSNIGGVTL